MELKRCSRCLLPETHETIIFDENGVCNICLQNDTKTGGIDWGQRKIDLDNLIAEYRGKYDYDCIVPFSGGKDSVWTLYYLVKHYKLKPLVVRFDHGFLRPKLEENTKNVLRNLGVDFLHFTPNWKVVQKIMLQSFLEKGDFCWHCHTGIFSYPMWVAIKFNTPLILWGEPSSEYTAYYSYDQPEEVDEKRFNRFINLGINADDMYYRLKGAVDKRDLLPYSYPPLKELRALRYKSVCLGSYIPWDVKNQVEIIKKELGWEGDMVENVPPGYDYEKIECQLQGTRDYIKYIKRGYTRPSHLASIDIRNKRLEREDGLKIIADNEGKIPASLELFLDFVGLTLDEFNKVAQSHIVSPHIHVPQNMIQGKKTKDFELWNRSGKRNREDALKQLKDWEQQNK
jgi:N-acetyl sugar amidotransferase